jgi:hypothetical protein
MLLAFKVVKEILIGVGKGGDRVIRKIAFRVMVEKNPVVILSLATLYSILKNLIVSKTYGTVVNFSLP